MAARQLVIPAMVVAMLLASCSSDDAGSETAPTEQPSTTEPSVTTEPSATTEPPATTAATSPTPSTSSPAADSATITPANVGDLAIVAEYADYVWLDFTPDGNTVALQGDKLAVLDQVGGELEVLVDEVLGQDYVTAISPNGRYILYVNDNPDGPGFSSVWDVEADETVVDLPYSAIAGAVFLPNSTDLIVAGTHLNWVDLSTGEAVDHGIEPRSTSGVLALMPDGTTLVTSSNGFVVFDSTETRDEIKAWDFTKKVDDTTFSPNVTGVSYSQDGALVAVGIMSPRLPELNAIHIIDYATDETLQVIPYELTGENPALRQVALSPDGSLLVAALQEDLLRGGRLEVFDVADGEPITSIPVEGAVQRVAFSPDGTLLAVGTTKRSGLKVFGIAG